MNLRQINNDHIGQRVTVDALVTKIIQTKGPTLFGITDGSGSIMAKAFNGAGKRAFPEIEENSAVNVTISIKEHNGQIEGDVMSMNKADDTIKQKILDMQEKAAKVDASSFMVTSVVTDKMRDRFVSAAEHIRKAIQTQRPILIRHHSDCDGYSSGVVLQRAIMDAFTVLHGAKDAGKCCMRSVCRAPFYSMEDAIRDVNTANMMSERFDFAAPLVLVVDNGSTSQDLGAITIGKAYGFDHIVVDHHAFGDTDVVSEHVLAHINPFLVDEDYNFTAGMLCTELAKLVNPHIENIAFIAAMAGLADHTESDALQQFIALAAKEGYSEEELHKLGRVVDYAAGQLHNQEGREFVADIFGAAKEKQQKIVDTLLPIVNSLYDRAMLIAREHTKKETHGARNVQLLDAEKTFSRGSYPRPGLVLNKVQDEADENTISLCYGGDFVSIRAGEETQFSIHAVLDDMHNELPHVFADGGGHHKAGSIKFVPSTKDEVLRYLCEWISKKG